MRLRSLLSIAVVFAATLSFAQSTLELKGDRMGMSLEQFKNKYDRVIPHKKGPGMRMPACSDSNNSLESTPGAVKQGIIRCEAFVHEEHFHGTGDTIADAPVDREFMFLDGKLFLVSATFKQDYYAHIVEALTAKFGAPSEVQEQEVQNRLGAKFVGHVVIWQSTGVAIRVHEFASSLDYSSLDFSDEATVGQAAKRLPVSTSDL